MTIFYLSSIEIQFSKNPAKIDLLFFIDTLASSFLKRLIPSLIPNYFLLLSIPLYQIYHRVHILVYLETKHIHTFGISSLKKHLGRK
jgi:hypothetical protein